MVRRVVLCAGLVAIASAATPCCDKKCELPLVKYFSTDAPHGFCGEACMDPKKFDIYHKFEANLTLATDDHPCSEQRTPDNAKHYTDYFDTVTHGLPGVLAVTLDLYAPKDMPDHSCCATPLFHGINCVGKPKSLTIAGTGPFCCPSTATETTPCSKEQALPPAAKKIEELFCKVASSKMIEDKAAGMICAEIEKLEPKVPAATCTPLVEAGWEKLVAMCPKQALPPAAKKIEELFCKVASSKMIEDKAAGMICAEIEKLEPKVPAATCTPLVEAGWEKLVAMCPKVAAPQEVMAGCEVGGESLCSCSELISKKLIKSFDDCSQEAAMAACNAGQCKHSGEVEAQSPWGDFVTLADSTTPCCDKTCQLPLMKYFSTDAPHGFCGEACMDPKKFNIYQKFEANLTLATSDHPCSEQYTPSNAKKYTDYFSTVTHGFPGVLTVTLDLYAPTKMVDHSCCSTPLLHGINCFGKPTSVSIEGTGPFCCPKGATETAPCAQSSTIVI